MMAHESPAPVPSNNNMTKKLEKSKMAPDLKTLPSGNPVNFGSKGGFGASGGSKKGKKPQKKSADDSVPDQSLPNGEKPRFSTENKPKKKTAKDAPAKDRALENKKGKKQSASAAVKSEETYAGSSFHSSPAALNLPKPSFKSSPKPATATIPGQMGPTRQPQAANQGPMYPAGPVPNGMSHQHFQPGMPAPPMGAAMPPGPPNMYAQPGFSYSVNPQGYINYHYPPFMPHHGPYQQMGPVPQAVGPPGPPVAQAPEQGQKITFNQLLGSQN